MKIDIRIIDEKYSKDINLKNESFELRGKFIPSYINGKWDYIVQEFTEDNVKKQIFPDENYDYNSMKEEYIFVGAYYRNEIIGLAIYKHSWNKYLYLYDLKVKKFFRDKSIGKSLIDQGKKIAIKNKYRGIYTQAQDNNLNACLFYLKNKFEIGGFDNKIYNGTQQEGKADIIFYLDIN